MARRALPVSRRSFVALVTGAAAASMVGGAAHSQATDNDPTDPAGGGSGVTDEDPTDSPGNGRGSSGVSDSDSGANGDCAGRGRGSTTGQSDSDSGSCADPTGNGQTGLNDSDVNDSAGYGRGRGSCPS